MTELEANADLNDELERLLAEGLQHTGIVISRRTLRTAIGRFLSGEISRQQLATWANLIEAHDQVQYEQPFEKVIAGVLFDLSSPEIHRPLNLQECKRLMEQLIERPEPFAP